MIEKRRAAIRQAFAIDGGARYRHQAGGVFGAQQQQEGKHEGRIPSNGIDRIVDQAAFEIRIGRRLSIIVGPRFLEAKPHVVQQGSGGRVTSVRGVKETARQDILAIFGIREFAAQIEMRFQRRKRDVGVLIRRGIRPKSAPDRRQPVGRCAQQDAHLSSCGGRIELGLPSVSRESRACGPRHSTRSKGAARAFAIDPSSPRAARRPHRPSRRWLGSNHHPARSATGRRRFAPQTGWGPPVGACARIRTGWHGPAVYSSGQHYRVIAWARVSLAFNFVS